MKPKKGWDAFDAQAEGIDLVNFIKTCPRLISEDFPTTPYAAFNKAISELYDLRNLEQFDGLFYIYQTEKHHWQERMIVNIESDIQKWIEKNMIEYLSQTDTSIHTFIKNTTSFLKHYSTGYYKGNPFKNSTLQPYIHVKNGAIEITNTGFKFHDREKTDENFFKKLYPLHALDFDFDMKYYKDTNLKDLAPTFYYYIKTLVPDPVSKRPEDIKEYEKELYLTLEFFSMIIAYVINPIKRRPYFFALHGSQDSGKSFFVNDLLQTIIGEQFFIARSVEEMTKSRFAAYDLWGAKVYLDDDVRSNITLPDAFIKFYSGCKSITIEPKFGSAIKGVKISVAMFFISNHPFTVVGGSEGLERRLIYIPYKKRLKKPDVFLLDKIIGKHVKGAESGTHAGETFDERPAIIGFALRGIESLIKNNHNFIMPNWIANERKDWLIKSNTITQFLHEEILSGTENEYKAKELYDQYKDWCKDEEARKPYGKNKFYDMLKLEPRVTFEHKIYGDYFVFELNEPTELEEMDIPF
jgi:phage/plasmid-associated DNA primase